MTKQIFVNLAVADLQKSVQFYLALGFTIDPRFTDETAICMVWNENICVEIMTHERFATFTQKPNLETKKSVAAIFSLSVESPDKVNTIMANGLAAGGTEQGKMQDHGFMQQRTIEDFDGHTWEIFYVDMDNLPEEKA
jgi:predicted lactoylglutathione lyase